jgi:hypothetical protein
MNMKIPIVFLVVFFASAMILFIFLTSAININELDDKHYGENNPYRDADLSVQITPAPTNTFGYDILMNGSILIHQPHIPALPGNEGFKKKEDAQKVAEFLIHKIRQNIFPPSASVEELDSLGALK